MPDKETKSFPGYGESKKYLTQVFEKNLSRFKFRYNDPFEYLSINEAGLRLFFKVFKQSVENPIKQFEKFKIYMDRMLNVTEKTYDIGNWKLVLLNKKPIGIIMPHIFQENPELGTLLNIGLVSAERGKGYGRIIHAKGLEILKGMGAKKYMGATDINNLAMLKVFIVNGCRKR